MAQFIITGWTAGQPDVLVEADDIESAFLKLFNEHDYKKVTDFKQYPEAEIIQATDYMFKPCPLCWGMVATFNKKDLYKQPAKVIRRGCRCGAEYAIDASTGDLLAWGMRKDNEEEKE